MLFEIIEYSAICLNTRTTFSLCLVLCLELFCIYFPTLRVVQEKEHAACQSVFSRAQNQTMRRWREASGWARTSNSLLLFWAPSHSYLPIRGKVEVMVSEQEARLSRCNHCGFSAAVTHCAARLDPFAAACRENAAQRRSIIRRQRGQRLGNSAMTPWKTRHKQCDIATRLNVSLRPHLAPLILTPSWLLLPV